MRVPAGRAVFVEIKSGVTAVDEARFSLEGGRVTGLIGPNGAGKTTVFNLISRIYTPTTGHIDYAGPNGMLKLTEQPPHKIASLGIARTFQNIELFEHASVLHNLLIGRHTHRKTGLFADMFFTGEGSANVQKIVIAEDALGYKQADRHHGKTGLRDIRQHDRKADRCPGHPPSTRIAGRRRIRQPLPPTVPDRDILFQAMHGQLPRSILLVLDPPQCSADQAWLQ